MESTNFIKLKMELFAFNELSIDEIVVLSFILSHKDNNQDFFYTDEQLVKIFNNKFKIRTIKRILSSLDEKEFIQRIASKKLFSDNSWGNRRTIILGNKTLKSIKPTKSIKDVIKPSQFKEKMVKLQSEDKPTLQDLIDSI